MVSKIPSSAVLGVEAYEVEVEVNGAPGKPAVVVVGLPDTAVRECKDRVTTAVANSGYRWPRGRCTVNLAPAHIKKEGTSFDLPIAVGNGRRRGRGRIEAECTTRCSLANWH